MTFSFGLHAEWLEVTKSTVQITTYASYQGMVERVIVPYFRKRGINW